MNRRIPLLLGAVANVTLLTLPLVLVSATARLGDPAVLAVLGLSTAWVLVEGAAVHSPPGVPNDRNDSTARRLARATGLTIWAILVAAVLGWSNPGWSPPVAAGLALCGGTLMLAGVRLRRASILALGRHFRTEVTVQSDQPLVMDGVFARCRHPSELGLLLLAVGAAAITNSLAAAAIALGALVPLTALRIRLEEAALLAAFPTAYPAYARRTPALLSLRR